MEVLLLLAVIVGAVFGVRALRDRRQAVRVDTWNGASVGPGSADAGVDGATIVVPRGGPAAVVRTLGRIEAHRLWSSAAFVVGLGLSVVVLLFVMDWSDIVDGDAVPARVLQHLGLMVYPLAGMTVLALNRATLRSKREGTEELFASAPTSRTAITGGHLVSVRSALVATAFVVVAAFVIVTISPLRPRSGPFGASVVAEVLAAFVIVAGAGALGVALARWLPHGIVAPIVLVGLLLATLSLNGLRPYTSRIRYVSPFATPPPELAPQYMLRPAWEHLLYLVGLATVVAVIAVLRTDRGRSALTALGIGAGLVVVGGWAQLRPVTTDEARRVAVRVETPADRCTTRAGVRACSFAGYESWRDDWITGARDVLALAPAAARPLRYDAVQAVGNSGIRRLDPAVREQLGRDTPQSGYGFGGSETELVWSLLPAQRLVGLPTSIRPYASPCYSGNQARAVVALWLAGAADPDALDDGWFAPDAEMDGIGATWSRSDVPWALVIWPAAWDTDVDAPVVYSRADVDVARQLRDRPTGQIRRALAADWDHWVDPATTTDELAAVLDVGAADTGARLPPGLQRCA